METEEEQPHLSFGLHVHMLTYESANTQQRTCEHSYMGVWPSGKVLVWPEFAGPQHCKSKESAVNL